MIKKTIAYTVLFSLILILPWAVKAQGPVNAPFVLKDAFTGEVDLSEIWTEINNLKDRILNIENSQPGTGSSQSIKVYDATGDKELGIFAGTTDRDYTIFFEKSNKFITINPTTLKIATADFSFYEEECQVKAKYIEAAFFIDENSILLLPDNQYGYFSKENQVTKLVHYGTHCENSLELEMVPVTIIDNPLPDNLQAPLKLKYK